MEQSSELIKLYTDSVHPELEFQPNTGADSIRQLFTHQIQLTENPRKLTLKGNTDLASFEELLLMWELSMCK